MPFRFDIPKLVTVITLVSVFTMAVRVPSSPDTWWHLRCGEVQWRTRTVLKSDVFSHTAAGRPWVNQSWLPQLILYGLYALGGFPALALAVAAMVTATLAFVARAGQERVARSLATQSANTPRQQGTYVRFWQAFVVLWAAISTGRVWAARPHLVTFCLTAVWVHLLDRHKHDSEREGLGTLRWLPPLMTLWANCHGGYVVGFVLLGAEIGGAFLDALWHRRCDGLWARVRPLGIITLLSALAALVNPQGIHLLLFPFQTLGSSAQQHYIAEWASPDFHAPDLLPFLALLLATWSALSFSERRVPGADLLRLLGFTAMALRSGRYLGLCAVVITPLLTQYGAQALSHLGETWGVRPSAPPSTRGSAIVNWALLSLILAAAGVKVALPLNAKTIAQVHNRFYPVAAVDYMRTHDLAPTLLNDYGWGGYLIWELYPHTPVFIDGRADPYGDELIMAYRQVILAQPGWQEILAQYDVHTALIAADGALASVMRESAEWDQVYKDDIATLFVHPVDNRPI